MKTQMEARKAGFAIDIASYQRPYAYKGPRHGDHRQGHEGEFVLTGLEAEMLAMLKQNAIHFHRIRKNSNRLDEAYFWATAQEKKVRALIKKVREASHG